MSNDTASRLKIAALHLTLIEKSSAMYAASSRAAEEYLDPAVAEQMATYYRGKGCAFAEAADDVIDWYRTLMGQECEL